MYIDRKYIIHLHYLQISKEKFIYLAKILASFVGLAEGLLLECDLLTPYVVRVELECIHRTL